MKALLGFLRFILGLFAILLIVVTWTMLSTSPFGSGGTHSYQSCPDGSGFDPSWERVAPLYIVGFLVMLCGLIAIRLPQAYQEKNHGIDIPIEDKDAPLAKSIWFCHLLPPIENRSEDYLWKFAIVGVLTTFFLRDQSLNWMLSMGGYRTPLTYLWDAISVVCAPLSGAVFTLQLFSSWRWLKTRFLLAGEQKCC